MSYDIGRRGADLCVYGATRRPGHHGAADAGGVITMNLIAISGRIYWARGVFKGES